MENIAKIIFVGLLLLSCTSERPEDLFTSARKDYLNSDIEESQSKYKRITVRDTSNVTELLHYGIAQHCLKNYKTAIIMYSKVIRIDSTNTSAYINRGTSYFWNNEIDLAVNDYLKAISMDSTEDDPYIGYADCLIKRKNYTQASSVLDIIITRNPNCIGAYKSKSRIYSKTNNWAQQLKIDSKVIELEPNFYMNYYNRAAAYTNLKQYESAITDLNQTIKLNSKCSDAFYIRGLNRLMIGDTRSCEDLQIALDLGNEKAKIELAEYCN